MLTVLIVSQIALSLALLVGAGLFIRSLQKLRDVQTGFNNADHVLLFSIDCYGTAYKGPALAALQEHLISPYESLYARPGPVQSGSVGLPMPILWCSVWRFAAAIAIGRDPMPSRLSYPAKILYLFLAMPAFERSKTARK